MVHSWINGSFKCCIEYLDDLKGANSGKIYLDSALIYSGAPVITVTGLSHLEECTVSILANSASQADKVVSGAVITLNSYNGYVIVGLPFPSTLETLRYEMQSAQGSSLGRPRCWGNIVVRLLVTVGGVINGKQIETRLPEDLQDNPVPLFSGDVAVSNQGWDSEGTLKIEAYQPLPLPVLGITGTLDL